MRTRYVAEIERLYSLGANEVIPEEFETSVEIFARVLHEYHVPRNVIALQVDLIRKEHYGTLRGLRLAGKQLDELSHFLIGATTEYSRYWTTLPSSVKAWGRSTCASARERRSSPRCETVNRFTRSVPNSFSKRMICWLFSARIRRSMMPRN